MKIKDKGQYLLKLQRLSFRGLYLENGELRRMDDPLYDNEKLAIQELIGKENKAKMKLGR